MLQSLQFSAVAAGLDPLHKGAKALLNISKKGKMKKYGVFSCIKVIKKVLMKKMLQLFYISFSSFF